MLVLLKWMLLYKSYFINIKEEVNGSKVKGISWIPREEENYKVLLSVNCVVVSLF